MSNENPASLRVRMPSNHWWRRCGLVFLVAIIGIAYVFWDVYSLDRSNIKIIARQEADGQPAPNVTVFLLDNQYGLPVKLPGGLNKKNPFYNCEWAVTDASGTVVFKNRASGTDRYAIAALKPGQGVHIVKSHVGSDPIQIWLYPIPIPTVSSGNTPPPLPRLPPSLHVTKGELGKVRN